MLAFGCLARHVDWQDSLAELYDWLFRLSWLADYAWNAGSWNNLAMLTCWLFGLWWLAMHDMNAGFQCCISWLVLYMAWYDIYYEWLFWLSLLNFCAGYSNWLYMLTSIYALYDSLLNMLPGYAGSACWLTKLAMLPAWLQYLCWFRGYVSYDCYTGWY
jgi:hypothetical protein